MVPGIGRTAHASGSGGGGCAAPTGPSCTFKGHNASVDFGTISNDQCPIFTDASILVFEDLQRPGNTPSQMAIVSIQQVDCNGILLEQASNFDPNTGLSNFTGTVQFNNGLTTGTMNGTATMVDNISGTTFTSTIHVTWLGYGPSTTSFDHSHFRGAGFIVNNRFHGSDRAAEASGTFTNLDGSNLASPTLNADISDSTGGTVLLSKS